MPGASARGTAWNDFALLGGKAQQPLVILIIDIKFFFFTKTTNTTLF
jgi:hypothetical protein